MVAGKEESVPPLRLTESVEEIETSFPFFHNVPEGRTVSNDEKSLNEQGWPGTAF